MKKPEIKYVGWCHECKCLGSFICGNCKPNEKYSFGRPSEFMPKNKYRWVRVEAKNRVEAEEKAKEYVDKYQADKFFECATNRVFKIIPTIEGDKE